MHRLTREVRFAINALPDEQLQRPPTNSYGGHPSLTGLGYCFALQLTMSGQPDPASGYLLNIKQVDELVRGRAIPAIREILGAGDFGAGGRVVARLHQLLLRDAWPHLSLESLRLTLSPFLSISTCLSELPMVRFSQKFEFSASHRLHNPRLSDDENRRIFGKCNNPQGHGHNYELQVTITGRPDENGLLIDLPTFERIVTQTVVERFDHKNLNVDVPDFQQVQPTVENIAATIYKLLKPAISNDRAKLASVTVWETTKTWCEYAEE
jgi:6-pyruvoyltetrahydropterin/6-carboxytetrahydropterin synthase